MTLPPFVVFMAPPRLCFFSPPFLLLAQTEKVSQLTMRNLWEYKLGNPNESSQQPQTQKRYSYHTEIVKLLSKLQSSNAKKQSSGSSSSSYALWPERSKRLPVQEHNQLWYWKQNTAKSGNIGVFFFFFSVWSTNFETNQNGFLHNKTMKKTQVDFLKRILGKEGGERDPKGEHSRQRSRYIFQPMWHIPVNSANHTGWNLQSMRWFAY